MRKEDLLSPKRWFGFVQAYVLKFFVPFHIVEQIMYRSLMCQDCLENGKCKHCGCHTPALFYSYYLACEENKWGPFLDKETWPQYKEMLDIKFKL